jgi:4-oxalocrotonate tautomerase
MLASRHKMAAYRDRDADLNVRKRNTVMPLATIKVIEGVFSADEKRRMIEKVTDAMLSVEGENLREYTVVLLEEVKSGDWGIGGKTLTTDDVKRLQAGR